jgi:hypothetical protein
MQAPYQEPANNAPECVRVATGGKGAFSSLGFATWPPPYFRPKCCTAMVCRPLGDVLSLFDDRKFRGLDMVLDRDPSKTTSWGGPRPTQTVGRGPRPELGIRGPTSEFTRIDHFSMHGRRRQRPVRICLSPEFDVCLIRASNFHPKLHNFPSTVHF